MTDEREKVDPSVHEGHDEEAFRAGARRLREKARAANAAAVDLFFPTPEEKAAHRGRVAARLEHEATLDTTRTRPPRRDRP